MSRYSLFHEAGVVCALFALLGSVMPEAALAKTYKVDCTKSGDLQKTIDSAIDGDTIEITGICMTNVLIRNKVLTLVGAASAGPHGITGVAAGTDGVRIENSRGTHLERLTISNPLYTGVRILYSSDVTMFDCNVSNSWAGAATGIWVQEQSYFYGLRLRLDNNLRGLGALQNSRAWCDECDLNSNASWAASARRDSFATLRDSAVTGARGLDAQQQSYIDIDCASLSSGHACSLDSTGIAGIAYFQSTVAFYEAGEFSGEVLAWDRSEAQLYGARQQSNPGANQVDSGSSLRVEPGVSGTSQLKGHTDVTGFSHALIYGGSTVLDGSLTCDSGGDAWVAGGIDLSGFTITGCDHAP